MVRQDLAGVIEDRIAQQNDVSHRISLLLFQSLDSLESLGRNLDSEIQICVAMG
jgi:hypothetical protein